MFRLYVLRTITRSHSLTIWFYLHTYIHSCIHPPCLKVAQNSLLCCRVKATRPGRGGLWLCWSMWLTFTIRDFGMEATRPRQRPLVLVGHLAPDVALEIAKYEEPIFAAQIVAGTVLLLNRLRNENFDVNLKRNCVRFWSHSP